MPSIEQQAVTALKLSGAARLFTQLMSWVVTLIVLRLLVPEDYGLMTLATVIVSLLATMAELGLGASLIQARALEQRELAEVAGAVVLANFACGTLVVAGAPLVGAMFGDARLVDIMRVAALHFVVNAAATVPQSLATRDLRFRLVAMADVVGAVLGSACTLTLALLGAGVWALVLGSLTGVAARAAILVLRGETVRPRFGLRSLGKHARFGGAVTASRMLWQFVNQVDILLAGRFLSAHALGAYSVSMHLATLPMQKVMGLVTQVAFPTVARLQDELPRLRARMLDAARLMSFAAVPALWGLSAVAPEFVHAVLGPKWLAAIFPLQVVTLVVPLRMVSALLTTSLAGVGRADLDLRNTAVIAVILPAAFLCGVQWGADGLAISWVIAVPLVFVVNAPVIMRVLGIRWADILALGGPSTAAGIVMYAAVAGVRLALVDVSPALRLALLIPVGAAAYFATVAWLDRRLLPDVRRVMAALRA